jgi:hypothetical protein
MGIEIGIFRREGQKWALGQNPYPAAAQRDGDLEANANGQWTALLGAKSCPWNAH